MSIACPCCRAANEVGPMCRRCRTDMGLMFSVEARREFLMDESLRLARAGRLEPALRALDEVESLRAGDDATRTRAAVLVLGRDFQGAMACYSAAGNSA